MSDGFRKCDSKDCEFPATHWLVWTEPTYKCLACAKKLVMLGEVMGLPTPKHTIRPLTIDEMITEETDNESE